jgi:nitrate reductase delta subunit
MTGAYEHAVVLQAASLLLQYPDHAWRERLPTVRAGLAALPHGAPRDELVACSGRVAETAAAELERHYVEVFDRTRRCAMHLTWWADGETRRRGLSLAGLKELYRSYGFELLDGELPDFLPVVLEFAAQADIGEGLRILQEHRAALELLRLALTDLGTPYAGVLAAVCALLPGASPADEAAARALARSGPPGETVGLDPYGPPAAGPPGVTFLPDPVLTSPERTGVRR